MVRFFDLSEDYLVGSYLALFLSFFSLTAWSFIIIYFNYNMQL